MTLEDYNLHATQEQALALKEQLRDAFETGAVNCPTCGTRRGIEIVYRCLYCGFWFCFECAEKHFGQTFQEHLIEKRIECRIKKRQALIP
jgi:hypothetical protein